MGFWKRRRRDRPRKTREVANRGQRLGFEALEERRLLSGGGGLHDGPALVLITHGGIPFYGAGLGYDANSDWMDQIADWTETAFSNNQNENASKDSLPSFVVQPPYEGSILSSLRTQKNVVVKVAWDRGNPTREYATSLADQIRSFLDNQTEHWDLLTIGHSRGAFFNLKVLNELSNSAPEKLDYVQMVTLDPTGLGWWDFVEQEIPPVVDRAFNYDDGQDLTWATSAFLAAPGLLGGVRDGFDFGLPDDGPDVARGWTQDIGDAIDNFVGWDSGDERVQYLRAAGAVLRKFSPATLAVYALGEAAAHSLAAHGAVPYWYAASQLHSDSDVQDFLRRKDPGGSANPGYGDVLLAGKGAVTAGRVAGASTSRDDYTDTLSNDAAVVIVDAWGVAGSIGAPDDHDWFQFLAPNDGPIQIDVTPLDGQLRPYTRFHWDNGILIRQDAGGGGGGAVRISYPGGEAGRTYFIDVSGAGSLGSYVVSVSQPGQVIPDPFDEPAPPRIFHDSAGEDFNEARRVALSQFNKGDDVGRIEPSDDRDFYRFTARAAGQVEIDVIPQGGLTTLATFYDAQQDANGDGLPDGVDTDASDSDDGISHFRYDVEAGGTYYVKVESKDQASTGPYELHIREYDPAHQPGGSGTDSPPEPLTWLGGFNGVKIELDQDGNGSSRGHIGDPAETDWYEIRGARAGNMLVTVAGINDDLKEFVTVYDVNGGPKDTDSGEFDGTARVGIEVEEGQVIGVAVSSHARRYTGSYTIEISQPDELPDDDFPDFGETPHDMGPEVAGNGFLRGRIEEPGDDDWFKIPVEGDGYMTVEVVTPDSTLVPLLMLSRDGTSGGWFESDGGSDDGRARVTFLPSTSHVWAKVSAETESQGSYTLNVWRGPNPYDDHPDSGGAYAAPRRLTEHGFLAIPGRIDHPGDRDAFRVEADQPGTVAVQVIPLTEGFKPFFHRSREHPDADKRENTSGTGRFGRAEEVIDDVQADPHNWINLDVKAEGDSEVPIGDYLLYVWQPESLYDRDPDTVGIEAFPIVLDGSGNGGRPIGSDPFSQAINHAGDKDVFQVRAASGQPVSFSVEGLPTFLRVYDAAGTPLMTAGTEAGATTAEVTLEAEREQLFYFEVSALNGTDTGAYAIDVSQPTDDHPDAPIFSLNEEASRDATILTFDGSGRATAFGEIGNPGGLPATERGEHSWRAVDADVPR